MISDDDLKWLEKLSEEIWQEHVASIRAGGTWWDEKRTLTPEELNRVITMAKSGDVVVGMANACMGFGISMTLYSPPPYPGTESEALITITNEHLGEGARFKDGWKLFSPIALSEANQKAYEFAFGHRLHTDQSYYDY